MLNADSLFQSRLFKSIVCILLVLGFLATLVPQSVSAKEIFSDVTPSNSHYPGILEAYENGFLSGYPDGTFRPNDKLSRANVTKSLGKLVLLKTGVGLEGYDFSKAAPFNDVPATYSDNELYKYSIIVKETGIFTGSNNNLLPNNLMTRQQMAKVLVNAFNLTHIAGKQSTVTDNHLAIAEFREYIDILSKNNVTTVSNFRPGETTTRAQFATFLTNANNVAAPGGPNPTPTPKPDPAPAPEPDPAPVLKPEPIPVPLPPTSLYVKDLLPIRFSELLIINLPKTVPVIYSDGSEKDHSVTWNKKGEDLKVGTHSLKGNVKDTAFTAELTVDVVKFVPFHLPGQPIKPYIPIPQNPPDVYKHANTLMDTLATDIKNAANALDASQKWGVANSAVATVINDYPLYNVTVWSKTLTEQWNLIEKRQADIDLAKKDAIVAVDGLLKEERYTVADVDALLYESISALQNRLNNAQNKIKAYENLDKKANTSQLKAVLAKQQTRIDDLKTVSNIAFRSTLKLENERNEFIHFIQASPSTSDPAVTIKWTAYKGTFNVDTKSDRFIVERIYLNPLKKTQWQHFKVEVTKGDAFAYKYFISYIPMGNFIDKNPPARFDNPTDYHSGLYRPN
ncbi:S-layer homology domain-containing protein [Sporosarcina sp. FA9]|uniref:S-layer homology domain-containing protein n=1 Tax=Sporosarcina sp. FA9 TaxID=3413030 RepID=UPI003F65D3D5